jgi:hypothetical protein
MSQIEAVLISARETTGSGLLSSVTEAEKVYIQIREALLHRLAVVVSFDGMTAPTTAYFSTAIGQLYRDFDEPYLAAHLTMQGLDPTAKGLVEAAIRYSKYYYADPSGYTQGLKEAEADYSNDD